MIKCDYVDHMGSDIRVANAARVSFNKETQLGPNGEILNQDAKLIRYLAKHKHFTPFTHPQITIRETLPIFIARQRFKHTVGFSYNEVSRRYVDDTPEFFRPESWRSRPEGSVKQGSGTGEIKNPRFPWVAYGSSGTYENFLEICVGAYRSLLEQGVAPEQARMVLPQSMLTSYYVTGSLAAFARAYALRIDPHAQVEIQGLAKQWDSIIEPLFPVSWAALTENTVGGTA